ncbi:MAG: hypothetical protein AAFQ98_20210 [Bacteroidota bacterium]
MKNILSKLVAMATTVFLSGCDLVLDSLTPDAVEVTGIIIDTFPTTDDGSSWDLLDDADLTFSIASGTSVLYEDGVYYEDVTADNLPLSMFLNTAYQLPTLNQSYTIQLYDDDDFSADDFIGQASFNPNDFAIAGEPEIPFSSGTIAGRVLVNWIRE